MTYLSSLETELQWYSGSHKQSVPVICSSSKWHWLSCWTHHCGICWASCSHYQQQLWKADHNFVKALILFTSCYGEHLLWTFASMLFFPHLMLQPSTSIHLDHQSGGCSIHLGDDYTDYTDDCQTLLTHLKYKHFSKDIVWNHLNYLDTAYSETAIWLVSITGWLWRKNSIARWSK